MTIQIGEKKLAISRGGDLNARLIDTTGCNVAEHAAMLAGPAVPFQIARALAPMLAEPMPVSELASAIKASDIETVRADVLGLLTATAEPAAKAETKMQATKKPAAKRKAKPAPPPAQTPLPPPDKGAANDAA